MVTGFTTSKVLPGISPFSRRSSHSGGGVGALPSVCIDGCRRSRMHDALLRKGVRNHGEQIVMRERSVGVSAASYTIAGLCLWILLSGATVSGQVSAAGSVRGVVRDGSGALVARANVMLISRNIGQQATKTTNATGIFVFPSQPVG